jgi:hypothetical protein
VAKRSKQPGGSSLPDPAADSKRHDTRKSVEFRDSKTATEYNCQQRHAINPGPATGDDDSSWIKPVTPKEWSLAQKNDAVLGKLVDLKIEFGANKIPKSVLSTLSANTRHYCKKLWPSITIVNGVLCLVKRRPLLGGSELDQSATVLRIVPRAWRRDIFDMMHAGQLVGAYGV